jgi:ankyrin repeat protein
MERSNIETSQCAGNTGHAASAARRPHFLHASAALLLASALLHAAGAHAADAARVAEAAKARDRDAVRRLIAQHADVNAPLADGATALHWTAQWADVELTALLIRAGAKVDAADDYGVTPLILAAQNGSAPVAGALLNAGSAPNLALPGGETPLMMAARSGNVDLMKALIAHGAQVNAKETTLGQTALMWAAAEKHVEVVRLLIEAGADVRARSNAGFTPLLFAARDGDIAVSRELIARGADVNETAADGMTALLTALIRHHLDYARFLLDQGADANKGAGYGPLHWAAGEWSGELSTSVAPGSEWRAFGGLSAPERLEMVKLLLAHGGDPNARVTRNVRRYGGAGGNAGSLIGATPFLLAAMAADVDVMRLLLQAGADPKATTDSKTTALMLAAGLAHAPGVTPISDASALAAVKLTLELGNDVHAANAAGETALHAAAYWGADRVAAFLVEKGAAVNAKNRKSWTPLVIAEGIYQGGGLKYFPSTAEVLRSNGSEPSPANVDRANGGFIRDEQVR